MDAKTGNFSFGKYNYELTFHHMIGKGNVGEVWLVSDERRRQYAMRHIKCDRKNNEKISERHEFLSKLKGSDFLVRHYAYNYIEPDAYIVMELCSNGTLDKRLSLPIDESTRNKWMNQLLDALSYLHENDLVHRDLKPSNVFITDKNDVKVGDFIVTTKFKCVRMKKYMQVKSGYGENQPASKMTDLAGTKCWLAPEVFGTRYDDGADVFSMGLVFCVMTYPEKVTFNGKLYWVAYFVNDMGLGETMWEENSQIFPKQLSDKSYLDRNVIKPMLLLDPEKRIALPDVRKHLNEIGINILKNNRRDPEQVEERRWESNNQRNTEQMVERRRESNNQRNTEQMGERRRESNNQRNTEQMVERRRENNNQRDPEQMENNNQCDPEQMNGQGQRGLFSKCNIL